MKKIYLGAAYYPELWDMSEVEKDIAKCKELGINALRIGEFAWGKMEPQEGKFDFSWIQEVVDKLYKAGIDVVMCTPSCTPPRWLLNKYEETRFVLQDGTRSAVSSRFHPCKTSPKMREKNRVIVTEMAKVFGNHPGVIGWQIDNEIFPYQDGCYCELCQNAFREYLKEKYGTVEKLNKSWGMYRWSLNYDSFEDIKPPYSKEWRHPSLRTAWHKFQCTQICSYVEEQAEILHHFTNKPVGTDMMTMNTLGYYSLNDKLDVVQFNHYETAKDLPKTAFYYDFMRPIKERPFWVTETQVGWNGGVYADFGYRPQGNCYVNTWLPIAKGAEMNMYWLFRAHPNGHELAHGALISSAGRQYRTVDEVAKVGQEFEKCKEFLQKSKVKSKIALHYSSTAEINFTSASILKGLNYQEMIYRNFYGALKHYNVDVIDTAHTLDGYEILISPFTTTLREYGFEERVRAWVEQGGVWIVGPMSDIMDENTCKYTNAPYSFLEEFAGVYTKYQLPVDNDVFQAKWQDGSVSKVSACFDAYETKDSKSLAVYANGEFEGLSVITERKIGKGKVVLLGSVPSIDVLRKLISIEPIEQASDNVIIVERTGEEDGIIILETENKEGDVFLKSCYKDLCNGELYCGKMTLNPYEVRVLQKLL